MTTKIENLPGAFASDTKRFYMPAKLEMPCPKCHTVLKQDLREDYFSYPNFNKPFDHNLYCATCDDEREVMLVVKISLELAP